MIDEVVVTMKNENSFKKNDSFAKNDGIIRGNNWK